MTARRAISSAMLIGALCAVASSAAAVPIGGRAPEIGLPDLAGHSITRASLRGQVFVVDFWGTWCDPCEDELPVLQRLYDTHHAAGFTVIAVTTDRNRGSVERFVSRLHLTFPIVLDTPGRVPRSYGSTAQPTSYLVDRRGIVRFVHNGFHARDIPALESEVATLVAEARPSPP